MVILAGDNSGKYHYCPVFDNGSALLSDLTVDYPLSTGYLLQQRRTYQYLFQD